LEFKKLQIIENSIHIDNRNFTLENKNTIISTVNQFISSVDLIYLTIDLDGFSSALAPGVSAPSPFGFSLDIALWVIEHICASGKLISTDIVELNPLKYIMEQIALILIYIHAFFGGIALLTGFISVSSKKGKFYHRRSGIVFSVSLLISSLIAIPITLLPGHENLLLHLLSIFTMYLVISGNRMLRFRQNHTLGLLDISITSVMGVIFLAMIILGLYRYIQEIPKNTLFWFFGGFGVMATIRDIKLYKTFKSNPTAYLSNHIGKMCGAFGAAITAFLLVALNSTSLWVWLTPSIVTLVFVTFWRRKIAQS